MTSNRSFDIILCFSYLFVNFNTSANITAYTHKTKEFYKKGSRFHKIRTIHKRKKEKRKTFCIQTTKSHTVIRNNEPKQEIIVLQANRLFYFLLVKQQVTVQERIKETEILNIKW